VGCLLFFGGGGVFGGGGLVVREGLGTSYYKVWKKKPQRDNGPLVREKSRHKTGGEQIAWGGGRR